MREWEKKKKRSSLHFVPSLIYTINSWSGPRILLHTHTHKHTYTLYTVLETNEGEKKLIFKIKLIRD